MGMKKGICKLCLLEKDLCLSHYMPRATYKYNRASGLKTPHPVMLTGGKPKQGTAQVKDYVLCQACENRFRVNGETWVLANIPHDYGNRFPLHEAVKAARPAIEEPGRALIAGKTTKGFDTDKLIYFGASIFWRGAAHRWPPIDGHEIEVLHLGEYQEQFRLFLLGRLSFPSDVSLTVMLWPFEKVAVAASLPRRSPWDKWERYWFYLNGLGFVVDIGRTVPEVFRVRSTSNSPEQFITIDNQFGNMVWKVMKQDLGDDFSELASMIKEIEAVRSKTRRDK